MEGVTPTVALSDAITTGVMRLTLPRSLGRSPAIRTTITGADGTILDQQVTSIDGGTETATSWSDLASQFAIPLLLVTLFLVLLLAQMIALSLRRARRS